jgi:hypothetical protein
MADLKRSTKLFMDETRARSSIRGRERPRRDTSGRRPATTDRGAERRHQAWSLPMPLAGAGSMLNGYCKASGESFRSMAMPDTTA